LAEHGVTLVGEVLGTPAFMPPEQARGHWNQVDGRSDLWAVGATLYNVLTGHPCREAASPNEALLQAMTQPVASVHLMRPDLPDAFVQTIDRALAFDKGARWPTARAFADALRECALDGVASANAPPPTITVPRGPAPLSVALAATVDATPVSSSEAPAPAMPDDTTPIAPAMPTPVPLFPLSASSLDDPTTVDASPFSTPGAVAHDLSAEEEVAIEKLPTRRAWLAPAIVAPIVFLSVGLVWCLRADAPPPTPATLTAAPADPAPEPATTPEVARPAPEPRAALDLRPGPTAAAAPEPRHEARAPTSAQPRPSASAADSTRKSRASSKPAGSTSSPLDLLDRR
jgi:serine/threonine-protein kinase